MMPHIVQRYLRKIRGAKSSRGQGGLSTGSNDDTQIIATASPQSSSAHLVTNNVAVVKNAAFQEAWENHLKELTEEEMKSVWSSGNPHISLEKIHEQTRNLDTKHTTTLSRKMIGPTLQFLRAFETLLSGATIAGQSSAIASIVMGVLRTIVIAAMRAGTYFERLAEMLERMPNYFDVLQQYADISGNVPILYKTLVVSYSNILAFLRKAHSVFTNKDGIERRWTSARIFIRAQWSSFEDEYGKILSDFEHHKQVLRDKALAMNLSYSLERKEAEREEIRSKKEEERARFLDWLSQDDSEVDHDRIYSKRYPGTGRWLLQEKSFTNWLDDDNATSLFWCHGQAGIGKSVLSSIVIDHLSKITLANQSALAFWYCRWDDTAMDRIAYRLVGMFIKQLCGKMSNIPSEVLEFYSRFRRGGRNPLLNDYIELFFLCERHFRRVFLVIDALDECKDEQRELILDFLQKLSTSHVKVFLASRWVRDVEQLCASNAVPLPITAWEVKDDIAIFVEYKVGEKLSIRSSIIKEKVITTLVGKSEGLFLWVELQLKDLSKVPECDLEEQLDYLPTGLDAMYIRMIRNIKKLPKASSALARRCVLWVTHSKQPLTGSELKELVSFIASSSKSGQYDTSLPCSSHKHYSSEDITNACFGLIQMDIDSKPIQLVHYSMQEVFSNRTDTDFPDDCRDFFLSSEDANLQLAMACIRILFSEDECWDSARRYCAAHFESHILSLQAIPPELEQMLDRLLSANKEIFVNILTLRYPYKFCDCCMGSPREIHPSFFIRCTGLDRLPQIASRYPKVVLPDHPEEYLQLSCYLGLSDIVDTIIATGADLNYRDQVGCTALDCACLANQHDIIQRLLDTKAPLACDSSGPNSPVIRAAKRKDFKTVELLLKGGMSVNLTDYINAINTDDLDMVKLITTQSGEIDQQAYESATRRAMRKGFHDISRFLINDFDSDSLQPLLCEALRTDKKTIRNLALECGPNWSLCLKLEPRLLSMASSSGDIETMNILIENGADIDLRNKNDETPLYSATRNGQVEAAELLLKKGADITVISEKNGTLLEMAAWHTSNIEVMELLIENGAIINDAHGEKGGPLGVAAACQALEKMELLLTKGADVNLPRGKWGSPLGTAVGTGAPKSTKFLLEKGAEVDILCPRYGSLLSLAAFEGKIEIMRLLIDKGADVNRQGGLFGCPLGAAAYQGNIKAIRLLLKEGARVNADGGFFGSPLGAAALEDNIEAMNILIDKGADVNIQGGPFGTPLGIAAYGRAIWYLRPRYTNSLKLLLEKGADINAPCGLFRNPLEVALFSCHSDALQILSEKMDKVDPPCPLNREYGSVVEMARSVEVQKWFLPKQKELDKMKGNLMK